MIRGLLSAELVGTVGHSFSAHRPKLSAVGEQSLDETVLRVDRFALLNNKQGHQAIGKQEQYREQRQKCPFLFCRRDCSPRWLTEQNRQAPPQCAPSMRASVRMQLARQSRESAETTEFAWVNEGGRLRAEDRRCNSLHILSRRTSGLSRQRAETLAGSGLGVTFLQAAAWRW